MEESNVRILWGFCFGFAWFLEHSYSFEHVDRTENVIF